MDWYLDTENIETVSELRIEIAGYLRRHGEPGSDFDAAEVIVSELLTNEARYANGPAWVSVQWPSTKPVMQLHDLGPGFEAPEGLPDPTSVGGRGLMIVDELADDLRIAARSAGGSVVEATLPVRRASTPSHDPPRHSADALPRLNEARPEGGFGKEAFLRALIVQLARAVEAQHGPDAAEAAVAQVGIDVGMQMGAEYRQAKDIVDRLTPAQLGECFVRLKHAIDGNFYVIEATDEKIVLGNTTCPFGDVVKQAPALCRMTSSVFGGIAAEQNPDGAMVLLEERIAVGDPGCRVVVYLGEPPAGAADGHRYRSPG